MTQDLGYTSEKCLDALNASTALVVGAKPGERKHWLARERHWEQQLEYARKAGR